MKNLEGDMSDDLSLLEWGFKTVVATSLGAGGWLWGKTMTAVGKNRDDLAAHKLYVSENYIKKDVIERIHDRLDRTAEKGEVEKLTDDISELQKDIKLILRAVGGNGRA